MAANVPSSPRAIREFVECGDAYETSGVDNTPTNPESVTAIQDLRDAILDPVIAHFGQINLTSGFRSAHLLRYIKRRAAPRLDQHCAHETNSKGKLICPRGGFAVDFYHETVDSLTIAKWITQQLPFDRLYFYGRHRPLHVSYGPDHSREIVVMHYHEELRRYIPRVVKRQQFLDM